MISHLFFDAVWSHAGKGLTSWLLSVMFSCVFVTFPCGILGQVWYLMVSIPDFCHLSYFTHVFPRKSHGLRLLIGESNVTMCGQVYNML